MKDISKISQNGIKNKTPPIAVYIYSQAKNTDYKKVLASAERINKYLIT